MVNALEDIFGVKKPIIGMVHLLPLPGNYLYDDTGGIEAIVKGVIQGVEKWQSEQESCYRFWRTQGSDCSVCLKVCPYSNPNTMIHNMVRWIVKRNNLSRHLIYYGDRLFYGKFRNTKYKLPDWHGKE